MTTHRHIWYEIESDSLGKPTKYKCISCNMVYNIKPKVFDYVSKHLEAKNSLINRIAENKQKIELIRLYKIDFNDKIHLEHLEREIITLNKLLTQY